MYCVIMFQMMNFMHLESYIPSGYGSGKDYIDKMKIQGSTQGDEVMIFATVQITNNDVVTYINGQWEWHCASVTFKKHTKMPWNAENRHFDPIIGF